MDGHVGEAEDMLQRSYGTGCIEIFYISCSKLDPTMPMGVLAIDFLVTIAASPSLYMSGGVGGLQPVPTGFFASKFCALAFCERA